MYLHVAHSQNKIRRSHGYVYCLQLLCSGKVVGDLEELSFTFSLVELFLLRTFAQTFSNIEFFLKILPLKDDELVMTEM